ncbi:iron ABC transporter permease [Hydrogenophilus islandicus]
MSWRKSSVGPQGLASPFFWRGAVAGLVALASLPLVAILSSFRTIDEKLWHHLVTFLLPVELRETALLLLVVVSGASLLGAGLAWLTTAYHFPGCTFFRRALIVPLAIPAYVLGYVYLAWFDVTGEVAQWLRSFGVSLPEIRNRWGAAGVLILALYPYVFLAARVAFATTGARALEVGQSLGLTRGEAFWRVALPLARPAIVAGSALVAFEVLADFGVVALYGVETLSVGIYKAWYALFSLPTAMQIAAVLAGVAVVLLVVEQWARRRARYTAPGRSAPLAPVPLSPTAGWLAALACAALLTVAFLLPVLQLVHWAMSVGRGLLSPRYWGFFGHSLVLGTSGAVVTVTLALLLAYAQRLDPRPAMTVAVRIATIGYALPGAVLAVGIAAATGALDRAWVALVSALGDTATPLLGGTIAVMLAAYAVRFLVVAFGPIQAALGRITPSMDEAAQMLGAAPHALLWRVHLPLLQPALWASAALVFIDVVKDLPITLMTRPFGWDTLATRIFELTNDGRWEEAALPALAVTLVGVLPALLLAEAPRRQRFSLSGSGVRC